MSVGAISDNPPAHVRQHLAGPLWSKYAPTISKLSRAQMVLWNDIFDSDCDKEYRLRALAAIDRIEERKRILRQVPKPAAVKVPAKSSKGAWHGKKATQSSQNAGQNQPQAPGIAPAAPSPAAPGPVELTSG